jgi:hypothetical protein
VVAEIASNGWERSPLLACFHPSVERVFEERLQLHRNMEGLRSAGNRRNGTAQPDVAPLAEPTLEEVRREYQPQPVRPREELTELAGLCLWDVFSDNHDVIASDGRVADINQPRSARQAPAHSAAAMIIGRLTMNGHASGYFRPSRCLTIGQSRLSAMKAATSGQRRNGFVPRSRPIVELGRTP